LGERYCESFNSKLRDELLNGEIFYSLREAKVVIKIRPAAAICAPAKPMAGASTAPGPLHEERARLMWPKGQAEEANPLQITPKAA
jgi:hypothetical protein